MTVSVTVSQKKVCHLYFHDNVVNRGVASPMSTSCNNLYLCVPFFHIFFTVKFRKDLLMELELKLPPPLKSVAALPCET